MHNRGYELACAESPSGGDDRALPRLGVRRPAAALTRPEGASRVKAVTGDRTPKQLPAADRRDTIGRQIWLNGRGQGLGAGGQEKNPWPRRTGGIQLSRRYAISEGSTAEHS